MDSLEKTQMSKVIQLKPLGLTLDCSHATHHHDAAFNSHHLQVTEARSRIRQNPFSVLRITSLFVENVI